MKPMSEWDDSELRYAIYHGRSPFLEDDDCDREDALAELLRRERERLTAEVHAKFRADLDLLVEATRLAAYERCATACDQLATALASRELRGDMPDGDWTMEIRGYRVAANLHPGAAMIPSDDYEAFLRTVREHPDADLPRLVFADWLTENGQEDYGEFIRVQCELIAFHAAGHGCSTVADHPPMPKRGPGAASMPVCGKCSAAADLEDREWELFHSNCDRWFPVPAGFGFDWHIGLHADPSRDHGYVVRRGFPAEVRDALAGHLGGECDECEGDGNRWGGGSALGGPCPACQGTGRIPGHLAELVRKWPIEAVVVVNADGTSARRDDILNQVKASITQEGNS